jgi:hypothetical protein
LQPVAVGEAALAHDSLTIDERSISAAEIADSDGVGGNQKLTVLPADPIAVRSDMAFRAAAENVGAAREDEAFVSGSSMNHN